MNDREDLATASEETDLDEKPLESHLKSEGEAVVPSEPVETPPKEDESVDYPHGPRLAIITVRTPIILILRRTFLISSTNRLLSACQFCASLSTTRS
jgi:hypothetical protein